MSINTAAYETMPLRRYTPGAVHAPVGGEGVLFEADMSQTTEAAMGFNDNQAATDPLGRTTRTVVSGVGGRNAIRIVHNPITEAEVNAIGNPQNTHGSAVNYSSFTSPGVGESIFMHIYYRLDALSDVKSWDAANPASTVDDALTVKMAIIAAESARIILHLQCGNFYGGSRLRIAKNIDTGAGMSCSVADGWCALIFEARAASTQDGTDGWVKAWKNSGTYASPTESITGQSINSYDPGTNTRWTSWGWNQFGNETSAAGAWTAPVVTYSLGGVKISTVFDTAWSANMGA